ncbi:MAG: valyl-tRNA synthetase [Patescibacteria group bacterium]|jgi:valyl-tRNA synthetase|nr:valyl-tRNA synthetase [Patescibacteria group bacterium]
MDDKFLKPYNPTETESRIYKLWEESGFFNPDICIEKGVTDKDAESFSLIMPPPNANGRLHAGHGLVITLGDITTRFNRMQGKKSLWVPGADHAGFETQIVYEKKLEKEGRSRFEMDPKDLYKEIYDFTIENKKHMEDDVRRLGASCDWEKEKFTLDPTVVKTVQETFDKMFKDGLIYRGERIVNWCSRHQTSLSEVETEFKEKKEPFYYFKYGPFTIGTSRPETKFGDKYVVMHPKDERYANYKHGDKLTVEWINGQIEATIIKDESVDMEFGTGVMTITPWHDAVDFEIAERHNLPKEQIIDFKGKLLPIAGEFAGLHISKARPLIVEKLKEKGLLEKIDEDYVHNIKVCYKCETTIEPQIKDQWFVKMRPLADLALQAVNEGKIEFIPQNFEKIFRFWMENTIDWNISRQIIWGIPIPAKICDTCKIGFSDLEDKITECEKCKGSLRKDTDTFDTWFSSGQWTLLALGYPNEKYLADYHPTTVMQTGRDLIFKWIPRMVIFSLYLRKEIPFEKVYLNGMVNDAKGQKMSKSKGNVVSPIEIADEFGADALRMGLIVSNAPGGDLSLVKDKIKGYKHFANKLWNITRFVLENTKDETIDKNHSSFSDKDLDLKKEQEEFIKEITKEIESYMFHTASEKIYSYTWHRLADQILEESKIVFEKGTDEEKKSRKQFLLQSLENILTVLHPFMPFITEEIWQTLGKKKLLIVEKWPKI